MLLEIHVLFQAGFKGASFDILLDESFDYARAAGFGSVSQTCIWIFLFQFLIFTLSGWDFWLS